MYNPDIQIGMDLTTIQQINEQARSDVNIVAVRIDDRYLTEDAKEVTGGRPVFEFRVEYGNNKTVNSLGAGSVSIGIPYILGSNENTKNVQAVYIDTKGAVHWLIDSFYDSVLQLLRFSTNHFSTFGVGYRQEYATFTDIEAHWAKEDIEYVVSRGLLDAISYERFNPNGAMTRGMFVSILGLLANADVSNYVNSRFTDVENNSYYMGYIEWASENGIVKGIGDKRFAPDQPITREQMVVMVLNYTKTIGFSLPKVHKENIFADSNKISSYAKDAIIQMQEAGVIRGESDNLFFPQDTATRAEISAVIHRSMELAISSDVLNGWTMNSSGNWMYFKEGRLLTGKQGLEGAVYTFDQYGVTLDVPKHLFYTTYTVRKGDSFWLIADKLGCSISELERINNKSRFSLIHTQDILRVPKISID